MKLSASKLNSKIAPEHTLLVKISWFLTNEDAGLSVNRMQILAVKDGEEKFNFWNHTIIKGKNCKCECDCVLLLTLQLPGPFG